MMTLTCCQDLIITEKIYVLYGLNHLVVKISGDVTDAEGTTNNQPMQWMDAGGWVSQFARRDSESWMLSLGYWDKPGMLVPFWLKNIIIRMNFWYWIMTPDTCATTNRGKEHADKTGGVLHEERLGLTLGRKMPWLDERAVTRPSWRSRGGKDDIYDQTPICDNHQRKEWLWKNKNQWQG